MKSYFLLMLAGIFSNLLFAQNFTTLGTDDNSDDLCPDVEITQLDYAIDHANDSIWFQFTIAAPLPANNYAFYIAVNNNGNLNDSVAYGADGNAFNSCTGNSLGYLDMKYDIIINHEVYSSGTPSTDIQTVVVNNNVASKTTISTDVAFYQPTNTTAIVRAKLSEVDPDLDGQFDVIGATGKPFHYFFDVIPNTNYYTTQPLGIQPQTATTLDFTVSPNPCNGNCLVSLSGFNQSTSIMVLNAIGQVVVKQQQVSANLFPLPVNELQHGVYFIKVADANNNSTVKKVVIQ